jgi:DNA relaxase NicK
MKFDYYSATVSDSPENLRGYLLNNLGGEIEHFSHGKNGYSSGYKINDNGETLATCFFGANGGANPFVFASSTPAIEFSEVLRACYPDNHFVTRADICEDFMQAGGFDSMVKMIIPMARKSGLTVSCVGDWLDPLSLKGRTLYIGSTSSQAMLRIYEKGKHQASMLSSTVGLPDGFLNWFRVEFQIKPIKSNRIFASKASPDEILGTSKWVKNVSEACLNINVPIVKTDSWRHSDFEKTTYFMLAQYGKHLSLMAQNLGGFEALGSHIEQRLLTITKPFG